MKKFVTLFIIILCTSVNVGAQTYLEHLQKKVQGQGTVTVKESKEIDELVNGKSQVTIVKESVKNQPVKKEQGSTKTNNKTIQTENTEAVPPHQQQSEETVKRKDTTKREDVSKKETTDNKIESNELDIPTLDLRKKVPRNIYKIIGYRVQVFAGGNSRADRQRAESIRNQIKINLPEEPIYVHFYSPRWICRVGNYRSLEEASIILRKIQAMGFKQACIVKGKITVQY